MSVSIQKASQFCQPHLHTEEGLSSLTFYTIKSLNFKSITLQFSIIYLKHVLKLSYSQIDTADVDTQFDSKVRSILQTRKKCKKLSSDAYKQHIIFGLSSVIGSSLSTIHAPPIKATLFQVLYLFTVKPTKSTYRYQIDYQLF